MYIVAVDDRKHSKTPCSIPCCLQCPVAQLIAANVQSLGAPCVCVRKDVKAAMDQASHVCGYQTAAQIRCLQHHLRLVLVKHMLDDICQQDELQERSTAWPSMLVAASCSNGRFTLRLINTVPQGTGWQAPSCRDSAACCTLHLWNRCSGVQVCDSKTVPRPGASQI